MELFREARKRKKLSHRGINARHQRHLDKVDKAIKTGVCPQVLMGNDGSHNKSVDSLDSIFCQIVSQDENIKESQRRLIQARREAKALKQHNSCKSHGHSVIICNLSISSSAADCSLISGVWVLARLAVHPVSATIGTVSSLLSAWNGLSAGSALVGLREGVKQ